MRIATEDDERQVWDRLSSLLPEAVPDGASESEAEDSIVLACMGHDREIHGLYEQVKRLARAGEGGYVRMKLEEDNPIARVHRRLYGRQAQIRQQA